MKKNLYAERSEMIIIDALITTDTNFICLFVDYYQWLQQFMSVKNVDLNAKSLQTK